MIEQNVPSADFAAPSAQVATHPGHAALAELFGASEQQLPSNGLRELMRAEREVQQMMASGQIKRALGRRHGTGDIADKRAADKRRSRAKKAARALKRARS